MDNEIIKTPIDIAFTENVLTDVKAIVEQSRDVAYRSVDYILVCRNWLLGKRIAVEELKGEKAMYGTYIVPTLAKELTQLYGKGFDRSSLYKYVRFYHTFPQIVDTLCPQSYRLLSWSHYRTLLQEDNADARAWYVEEIAREAWSVRTLQRNISSQYYQRMLVQLIWKAP